MIYAVLSQGLFCRKFTHFECDKKFVSVKKMRYDECMDTFYTVCVESSESVIRLYVKVEGEDAGGSGDSGDDVGDAEVGREVSIR